MVRREPLVLFANLCSDSVTKNVLLGCNLKTLPKSFGHNISPVNNCVNGLRIDGECVVYSRCFLDQHWRPIRHPVTTRMKWNKQINNAVIECYYPSRIINGSGVPFREYRKTL